MNAFTKLAEEYENYDHQVIVRIECSVRELLEVATLNAKLEAVNERCRVGYEALAQANENFYSERKAHERTTAALNARYDGIERAEAAESRLATIKAETIERCAKVFEGLTFGPYLHPSISIRALKSAAPQEPPRRG